MTWAGVGLCGVGALLLVLAAVFFGAHRRHVARAERLEGTVVGSRARLTGVALLLVGGVITALG